jgi:hypothetical protein
MSRTISSREGWHPQTQQDRDAILLELQEILASPHFCNSKRYPALLQFIVENTLAGKSDLLKERTLGVEVFDRQPNYDTNADTVVRYTAGEVRKRLLLYYSEHGSASNIRISLPAGCYVPEFLQEHEGQKESTAHSDSFENSNGNPRVFPEPAGETHEPGQVLVPALRSPAHQRLPDSEENASPRLGRQQSTLKRWMSFALAALVVLAAVGVIRWKSPIIQPHTAVDDFWGPVIRDQHTVLICTGGVIFQQNGFSGVITAGKDIEYPFVSMQTAAAISQISSLVERFGATTQLLSSPSTQLTELREHSVVLLGGYNNQWAMRLLQSQQFQFTPEPVESIIDRTKPEVHWSRDRSLPYSSADDYALIARFRDTTTGSWVVALAGLGRNGTEAAAQFVASPHYMELLREQLGSDFSNRNIEVVLRVSVVEGKTGAPSIQAVHTW